MPTKTKKEFPFGKYLKQLREQKGASLLDVEKATGISNAYLSQLETGTRKRLPTPERLRQIANYYSVTMAELIHKAGYYESSEMGESAEKTIEREFVHILTNPAFSFGAHIKPSNVPFDVKQFIVELNYYYVARESGNNFPGLRGYKKDGQLVTFRWFIDDVKRDKFEEKGVLYLRYRVKVTCREAYALPPDSKAAWLREDPKRIIRSFSGEGECVEQAVYSSGYENPMLRMATNNALKKTLNHFADFKWIHFTNTH